MSRTIHIIPKNTRTIHLCDWCVNRDVFGPILPKFSQVHMRKGLSKHIHTDENRFCHRPLDFLHSSIQDVYLLFAFHTCWSQQLIGPSGIPPTHRQFLFQANVTETLEMSIIRYCHFWKGLSWKMALASLENISNSEMDYQKGPLGWGPEECTLLWTSFYTRGPSVKWHGLCDDARPKSHISKHQSVYWLSWRMLGMSNVMSDNFW